MVVMSADKANALGLIPMATIRGYSSAALEPAMMGLGPVAATRKLMKRTGFTIQDFDLIELNEAFAAQALATSFELGVPNERLNVNGGAIALGHPIGTSGARILVTLLHELEKRGGAIWASISMCRRRPRRSIGNRESEFWTLIIKHKWRDRLERVTD